MIQPKFNAPARLVLGLGLILGLGMLLLVPPFAVPDEWNHFLKAYQLSEGRIFAHREHGPSSIVGDEFPSTLSHTLVYLHANVLDDRELRPSLEKTSMALKMAVEPKKRQFQDFPNTALYSPVPYVPAAAAIAISRRAGASPLAMFYSARAANLIAFILLSWCAVLKTPILRTAFAIVALLPMSLFLAASLSADAVTLGLAMLAIAATLDMAIRSETANILELARLLVLYILIALCKQAYVPLMFMFFLVPVRNCGGRVRYAIAATCIIGVPVALNIAWAVTVKSLYYPMMPGADPAAQLHFTLSRPLSYFADMAKAMIDGFLWINLMGVLSWMTLFLPKSILKALWLSLTASVILDGNGQPSLSRGRRLLVLGICAVTAATVITFVNLSWQTVGAKGIVGLQPRYFLPLLPLLLATFRVDRAWPWLRRLSCLNTAAIVAVALLGSIASWVALFQRFYL